MVAQSGGVFMPQITPGCAETLFSLKIYLDGNNTLPMHFDKIEQTVPAVILVDPLYKWSPVYTIPIMARPYPGVIADFVNRGRLGNPVNHGMEGIWNFFGLKLGV